MAFNFGAFAAGFAQSAERSILQQTQRRDEEEDYKKKLELQFEYDERARANAASRAAASERDKNNKRIQELVGQLKLFGYSDENISQFTEMGEGAIAQALDVGSRAVVRGMDPNTIFSVSSLPSEPINAEFVNKLINVDKMSADQAADAIGEISSETASMFGLNRDAYSSLFGEPKEVQSSYGAALAVISQEILRTNDPNRRFALEEQRKAILKDYREMNADPSAGNGTLFNSSTLPNVVNTEYRIAMAGLGFKTDVDGNVVNNLEGHDYLAPIGQLRTAEALFETYHVLDESGNKVVLDRGLNNRINTFNSQAERSLLDYAVRTYRKTDSLRRYEETIDSMSTKVAENQYRLGDVFFYTDPTTKAVTIGVYTGIPNPNLGGLRIMTTTTSSNQ